MHAPSSRLGRMPGWRGMQGLFILPPRCRGPLRTAPSACLECSPECVPRARALRVRPNCAHRLRAASVRPDRPECVAGARATTVCPMLVRSQKQYVLRPSDVRNGSHNVCSVVGSSVSSAKLQMTVGYRAAERPRWRTAHPGGRGRRSA